jgi:hypothetical protein
MRMRLPHAILMVLFLTTIPVFAQDQPASTEHQRPDPADIVAKMQVDLNLTQDQAAAITPIVTRYSSRFEDIKENMGDGIGNKNSLRLSMKRLKVQEDRELSQILSPDQMSQLKQMQSQPTQ